MIFSFKVFFPSFFKVDLHSRNVSHNSLVIGIFQSPFKPNEMFCLPNKFVLFTNHKQSLKCVQQNSCLDLWSNTLSNILSDKVFIFLYSCRLEEIINKLLTKQNYSQVFQIHFTFYLYLWWSLYLWWRVSRVTGMLHVCKVKFTPGWVFFEIHVPFTSGWKMKISTPRWNRYFDISVWYFECFRFIKIQIFW